MFVKSRSDTFAHCKWVFEMSHFVKSMKIVHCSKHIVWCSSSNLFIEPLVNRVSRTWNIVLNRWNVSIIVYANNCVSQSFLVFAWYIILKILQGNFVLRKTINARDRKLKSMMYSHVLWSHVYFNHASRMFLSWVR